MAFQKLGALLVASLDFALQLALLFV